MKTPKSHQAFASAALAVLFLAAPSAIAAIASSSLTQPVVDGEDIANYSAVSGTDKWFLDAARGQSITTGGAAVRLKAISYQVSEGNGAEPTKTYTLRVGKISGTNFTQIHSETATQNVSWTGGQFMTWTFDTPVLLEPYTTYGIDVGMTSSTSNWQSGIPYINVTADDYAGGTSYSSGASGIGTASITSAIASDRTFHLDMEAPLGPVFSLVSPSPADNATDVFATREIVMTFSQNITPGTGNFVIRNLTDNTDTTLAPGDSRFTYDQNVVRLNPDGLLTWNKNYAIRIDAGFFLGDANAPIPAITDDTTWNFTTVAGDPLLDAIAAIKGHVNNTAPLTGPQISAQKTTIDNNRQRFAENTTIINAVFDLITTYDTVKGPLFVSGYPNNSTSFDRNVITGTAKNSISPENYHWVIYTVMQHAMDLIYTSENLANYEATLTNYKFGSHSAFPGPCSPPANPANTHNVQINGSFPVTFGRNTQMWTSPARKPTGTYLAPGTIATVTVPAALVNAGYKIRVGAHSWDLSGRRPVNRLERATRLYTIDSTTTRIASPYGGGIYIEVPIGANAGVANITVTGGVRAPYFSAKTFHQTTPTEWTTERTNPAPWADFQSEKFMFQVPRKWIYNMTGAQATQLMVDWDKAMDAINSLMGFDLNRGKETMYCQTDVILRSSVHAPGYPAVNVTSNVNSEVSPAGYAGNYLVRGPATTLTAANIEFHEQGHAYGFPKFGGESESNVNLLQPAMLYRGFGKTIDEAQNGSFGGGRPFITVDTTAIAWMCVFSFSPNEIPMQQLEKQYQHKGHAKWMDIARIYATPSNPNAGWEKLDAYWRSFMLDDANNVPYGSGTDDLLLRLSRHVGKDIRPIFHFWGIHPQNPSALAAALAAENLTADIAIRAKLLHYKSIVPANNAAFQSFCLSWWGRKPTVAGAWEETDHAMQWDSALDADGTNNPNVRPNGSIYVETSATEIRNRVDELVDLYFPSAITPNPMTFAVTPTAVNATTIGMVATTANAAIGPIEYYFDETSGNPGGSDSGWQTSPTYQDSGLTSGLTYSYTVTARDGLANLTDPSAAASVPLTFAGDITAPAPDPMTFATSPYAVDETTITMTATTATDINSVEYEFENTSGGGSSSGWQGSSTFIDGELSPSTEYGYRVRARDSAGNVTGWSDIILTNTADIPDVTSPQIVSLFPANGTDVTDLASNLVVTFDEPVAPVAGFITLKNLTDGSQSQISVNDPAVSVVEGVMTINPPADLLLGKTYAVRMDANAVADASNNPSLGINDDTTWSFEVILENPLADAGGPYIVPLGDSLALDGGGSQPSDGQTITLYEWDLNNDSTFGDVTGATPASISEADLVATWGMSLGQNTIGLKVTDSAGKTATATTSVNLGVNLTWDANGATANRTDGAGAWLDANKWWDGGANTGWTSGATATFGNGGTGGAVTLASPTTAASLTFNSFTGTYTLGTAGNAITLNNGIAKNAGSGSATVISPLILGGAQTWTNSTGNLTSSGGLDNGGFLLTIGGNGNTTFSAGTLTGAGGLTKNGSGILTVRAATLSYGGPSVINGGVLLTGNNLPSGNMTLNNGSLSDYYRSSTVFGAGLGAGNNQIQIYGDSGFGGGNGNSNWGIGAANSFLKWGSTYFNPTKLILRTPADNQGPTIYGQVTLQNGLDLNGATRTIEVLGATGYNSPISAWGKFNAAIKNDDISNPAGLIKTGEGILLLSVANTYNGGTTVNEGIIQYDRADAMPSTGNHAFNDGSGLWVKIGGSNQFTAASSGAGSLGGLLTGTGTGSSTTSFSGTVDLTLYPSGSPSYAGPLSMTGGTMGDLWIIDGSMTLGGTGSYTGATKIGRVAGTAITVSLGSSTALSSGTPVTVDTSGSSALDLNGYNATIGLLALGSNSGGARGQVTDTAGTGTLTLTNGVFCDDHNNGNGGISAGFLDLNGATQVFQVRDGTQASDLLVTSAVQNGSLTMTGLETNATMELSGACTYAGGTNVTAGKLTISGSLADSSMVISGGTVSGTGTLNFKVNGTACDLIDMSGGTLDLAGLTLHINQLGSGANQAAYVIIDSVEGGSYTGTFNVESLPSGYTVDYNYDGFGTQVAIVGGAVGTPEIVVEQPAASDIANGGSRDFGTVTLGSNTSLTFTVRNTGTADLNLTGTPLVDVTGANAANFIVTAIPTTPVTSVGGTTTFTVRFAPSAAGTRNATLVIANNDSDENPFTINVSGTGQTAYDTWSGSAAFNIDSNDDGVDNGVAWLLGAADKNANATGKLPVASQISGNLVLKFTCLKVAHRGVAVLKLQSSNDLGVTDPWTSHEAVVPDTDGTVNGVVFVTSANGDANLINVQATIPAASGTKLFGRLSGTP